MNRRFERLAKWLLLMTVGCTFAFGTCAQIAARSTINGFFDAYTPELAERAADFAGLNDDELP